MKINFVKMQAAGNDFVILETLTKGFPLRGDQIRKLADRHYGVGCDQLLLLEATENQNADFRFRIFNPDGQEVEQCGNGARCIGRFSLDQGFTLKTKISLETINRLVTVNLLDEGLVDVDAELKKIQKELDQVEGHLKGVQAKLSNPNFTEKAPKDVVDIQINKEIELKEIKKKLEKNLSIFKS